jgi:hypothetical protein
VTTTCAILRPTAEGQRGLSRWIVVVEVDDQVIITDVGGAVGGALGGDTATGMMSIAHRVAGVRSFRRS